MELTKYKLGDIADISVGFPFESERFNEDGDGVRLVRGMNVSERTLRFGDESRWWSDITENLEPYFLKENDIVIGMDGSKVGKNFALIKQTDLPLLLVQRVACIRAKKGFDQNYIWHYVSSPRFIEYVNTIKTGSAIPHISGKQIGEFPIFVPPLSEQKKIASVLSALDDKIALNKKMNQKLEAMAKRLYDYWFVQYDFSDKNGRPYKTSGGPMTYNPTLKREIPTGWEVSTLANFAEYVKITTKFDSAFNYVSTDNMLAEKQGLSGEILRPASGNVLCYEKDDILISNIRPYFKKIWYADQSGTCSTDVLCVRSLNPDDSYFVYRTLWQDDFFDYVMQGAKGSKMPRGDKTRIMNYPICIAKENFDELIKKFSALVIPMQAVIQKNTKEISRLTKLRDKLLPLLMNGQVMVG